MFELDGGTAAGLFGALVLGIIMIFFYIDQGINRKKEIQWLLKNIRKTKLISVTNGDGSQSYTTTHGAIGRAAIGSVIAGPVGGIIGASTASTHTTTTNEPAKYMFMVYLKDGSRKRDTVKETDKKFEIYMDYIDMGDEEPEQYAKEKAEPVKELQKEAKSNTLFFAYCPAEDEAVINVMLKNADVWMTRKDIANLFGLKKEEVRKCIQELFSDEGLDKETSSIEWPIKNRNGEYRIKRYYNLSVIFAVGYSIDKQTADAFLAWADGIVNEYAYEYKIGDN